MPGNREFAYVGPEKHYFISRKLEPGVYQAECSCNRLSEVFGKYTTVLHTWRKHTEDEAQKAGVELRRFPGKR